MKKEGLTAKAVQFAKPQAKRYEIPAGPPSGLYLVVHPSGLKGWCYRYRFRGRTRNLTFEKGYPELGLSAARAEAESKQDELENEKDPAIVQAEEILKEEPNTVKAVAEEWISRHVKPNTQEKSCREFQRIVDVELLPKWKHKYITEIAKPDILKLLDVIVDRKAPITANRVFEVIRGLMNWSIDRGYITTSPTAGIKPPSIERSRDRVLDQGELADVWNAAGRIGYPNGPFIQFLILTAQRRGEVASMEWSQVDLDKGVWTLPAENTKSGRVHDVQLSAAAVELLATLPRFKKGDFVFTTTSGEKPISGFSKQKGRINKETLKRRKVVAEKAGLNTEKLKNLDDWIVHDLRRTAATHMAQANVPPHVLAAILNHTPGSTMGVTSIYNRFRYTDERRAALEAWAQFVLSLEETKVERRTA